MLNGTHALSGAAVFVGVAAPALAFTGAEMFAGATLCALAATAPDIDSATSRPSRVLRVPVWRVLPHRGPTHYLVTSVALAALLWLLVGTSWWSVAFILGWLTHQLGDVITVGGLRWLWPVRIELRSSFIHAGGWFEKFVIFPALLLWLICAGVKYL